MKKAFLSIGLSLTIIFSAVSPASASTVSTIKFYRNYIPSAYKFFRSIITSQHLSPPPVSPISKISPTTTPTPTSLPTPDPSPSPSPLPTPSPAILLTVTPTPSPSPTPNVLAIMDEPVKTFIMNEINSYRKSLGLSEVHTDEYTCSFAKVRAEEISNDFSHEGFRKRIDSGSIPYPSYSLATENIELNENYRNVVNVWINSPEHAENMRKDTPFVCVEQYGMYYAYQGYKP